MAKTFQRDVFHHIGLELRKLRIDKGLLPADIAAVSDLSLQNILSIEEGRMVAYEKYRKYMQFFGKRVAIALTDINPKDA